MRWVLGGGLLGLTWVALLGCGDDADRADRPPAMIRDGGRPGGPTRPGSSSGSSGDRDAGMQDEDAGAVADGGFDVLREECRETEPAMFVAEDPAIDPIATSTLPADFQITRVVAAWDGDCEDPAFRIELSDGNCPDGRGHALAFRFDADAIRSGSQLLPLTLISEDSEANGIEIRYVRPDRLDPDGVWGTCAGATGMLNLFADPSVDEDSVWSGTFYLMLTRCGEADVALQEINGSFNTVMVRGLDELCGDAGEP